MVTVEEIVETQAFSKRSPLLAFTSIFPALVKKSLSLFSNGFP
jgi:hypothetical protein